VTGKIRLQVIVEDMRDPGLILRSDRSNFRAKPRSPNMNDLKHAGQQPAVIELDHEFKRIARFNKQSAFDPDARFTHVEDSTGRRQGAMLKTTDPAHADP
jgi:hypothetical protein